MGMGLPPVASYMILAILAAPAMTKMGVLPMAAHLFIFYFGTISAITPPVAFASYTAAGIAKADTMKTGLYACRLGIVAFVIPFMFVYGTSLIFQGSALSIVTTIITSFIGVFALSLALEGYWKHHLKMISRCLLLIGAFSLMIVGYRSDIVGLVLITIAMFYESRRTTTLQEENACV